MSMIKILAMMEVLGIPPAHLIEKAPRKKLFFEDDKPKLVPNSKGKVRQPDSLNLATVLNSPDASFVDLIKKCLNYDPDKRLTPDEALVHDWILEGLPPSLHMKHLKLVETDENAASYQSSMPTITQPQGYSQYVSVPSGISTHPDSTTQKVQYSQPTQHTQHIHQAQPLQPTYSHLTQSTHQTSATHPTQPDVGSTTNAGASQMRKTGLIFAGQVQSRERKDSSKETKDIKPTTSGVPSSQHYIPKDFARNVSRKSKRSINLNIKSETTHEDDSIINITINLTGAKTHGVNKSLGTAEDLAIDKIMDDKKKVSSTKNSKINLLNNFFQNPPVKRYNTLAPNTIRKEGDSPMESTIVSPKSFL